VSKKETTPVKVEKKKHFTTPTDTWWGKLIVWVIVFGMVGLILLAFIFAIVSGNA
jgi:hypothetical protein